MNQRIKWLWLHPQASAASSIRSGVAYSASISCKTEDMIAACGNVDVLILEGLKDSAYPKVEVVRRAVSEHKVCATEHLIAVATDVVTQDAVNCPVYDMNDIAGIYACILVYFGISGRLR